MYEKLQKKKKKKITISINEYINKGASVGILNM